MLTVFIGWQKHAPFLMTAFTQNTQSLADQTIPADAENAATRY